MDFKFGGYYHLFNRSNDKQRLYRCHDNYIHFLSKYERMVSPFADTLAYCLMPTHYHFLIQVKTSDMILLQRAIGKLQSSYTQNINRWYSRTGSLFQLHAKSKPVYDTQGMIRLMRYIHQNPVRAGHVLRVEDWPYSSVKTMVGNEPRPIIRLLDIPALEITSTSFLQSHQELVERRDILDFIHNPSEKMWWSQRLALPTAVGMSSPT